MQNQNQNQFQCKTEKLDFMGFGGNNNGSGKPSNQRFFSNENQSNNMFSQNANNIFNGETTSPPFSNSNSSSQQNVNMPPHQSTSSMNGNMTSQHIHKYVLISSLDCDLFYYLYIIHVIVKSMALNQFCNYLLSMDNN